MIRLVPVRKLEIEVTYQLSDILVHLNQRNVLSNASATAISELQLEALQGDYGSKQRIHLFCASIILRPSLWTERIRVWAEDLF